MFYKQFYSRMLRNWLESEVTVESSDGWVGLLKKSGSGYVAIGHNGKEVKFSLDDVKRINPMTQHIELNF